MFRASISGRMLVSDESGWAAVPPAAQQPVPFSQPQCLGYWDITQHSPSLVHETSFWYLLAYISHLQPALTH